MRRLLVPFLFLCLVTPLVAGEQDRSSARDKGEGSDKIGMYMQEGDLENYQRMRQLTDFSLASSGFEDFPMSSDIFETAYRSPGKSFLYSMAVPGTGQLYTGSRTKAVIFMGVEVLAWAGYLIYHGDGVSKEDAYREFADQNWDPELYYNWLVEEYGITDDNDIIPGSPNDATFTHHLPDTKTQQYYEMIGKYDQFQYGWVDTDYRRGDETSDRREKYLQDRDDANKAFGKAKIGAIVSIANHLVSAFDAALTARRYNREQDTFTEYRLVPSLARYEDSSAPTLTFIYKF